MAKIGPILYISEMHKIGGNIEKSHTNLIAIIVPKVGDLGSYNDLEPRNGRYFASFHRDFKANDVKPNVKPAGHIYILLLNYNCS